MHAYVLATLVCLYFFRDKILGVFCSQPGQVKSNMKTALMAVVVSFFPVINSIIALGMVLCWLWEKFMTNPKTPA